MNSNSLRFYNNRMQSRKRQLRYNASCSPHPNIFRNQKYILNSGCQYLPQDIFNKVSKFQTITCDEINSLTFVRNQPHQHILSRMNEAYNTQSKMINRNVNFQLGDCMQRNDPSGFLENDMREIRIIKSEENVYECEQEILNHPCFKNDLANLFNS